MIFSNKKNDPSGKFIYNLGIPTPLNEREEFLSVQTLARKTGYSVGYLKKLLHDGKIRGVKVSNFWTSTLEAVNEYKNKGESNVSHKTFR